MNLGSQQSRKEKEGEGPGAEAEPASGMFLPPYDQRLKVVIFRRAGARQSAQQRVEVAELSEQGLFRRAQIRIGEVRFGDREARSRLAS